MINKLLDWLCAHGIHFWRFGNPCKHENPYRRTCRHCGITALRRHAQVGDEGAFMDSLTDLIRGDETYVSIESGKCKVCGEPYALIHGSNRTFRKDGRRYARVNCEKIGWDSFRCSRCKEVIEETWVRVETTSPTI